ncbi:MAG: ATP-dependent RNA helicase HrpA [Micropruina sp.]
MRIQFDPALPISALAGELVAAIQQHQVLIVAGETGSGKTTQLPKLCLLAGRKKIGHTQPRRIAARSVAERIAEELGSELGDLVGYQVRFTTRAGRATKVKVMTDGVLLAEIAHDPDLRRYDTLIIDEAHERSLNIDFLLGYLKVLLVRRPDLRVIVTSATIDTERFSEHFGGAPIIEVAGRTYPVDVRYRPVIDGVGRERDQVDAICDAVTELAGEGSGDILVFCSGERDIRDAAEAVEALQLPFTEVLPLYARLSAAEQHRVFSAHTGRRVVLATNVAETSLTVPGIRYVVDPGFARISRYSARTKVQRLPIEPVSRASANQRSGRCGRVAPGICIRLYDEEDYLGRPEFTEPEILRTNLASVILQMAAARLGDIEAFPFVEAPDSSQVMDGMRLLRELGAVEDGRGRHVRLTEVGRVLARLPVDPRLGRMLVEAERQGCLREAQVVVAGLAIQDVRERPAERRPAADEAHRRFWGPDNSDLAAMHRLWQHLDEQRTLLSGNGFRRMCRDEFLHFLRIREWQDLHAQLRTVCRDLGLQRNDEPAAPERIHIAALAGLLSHVGLLDVRDSPAPGAQRGRGVREYLGARGARFAINPGSSAAKVAPPLVMAVELVETNRLWARTVAPIEPAWVEEVGEHLLKRSYSEPRWSARGGQAVATEKVTLLGVPIIAGRIVSYGRIDPEAARTIFIQSALVEGQWQTRHHFFARNQATRKAAAELEERTRRRDIVVDDAVLFDFYHSRIPLQIVTVAAFDRWWRDQRRVEEHLLDLTIDDLLSAEAESVSDTDFPLTWQVGEVSLDVDYVFDPGAGHDGVSVEIDLGQLNRIPQAAFTWQVPGYRHELATELIRGLPKQLRTRLVPAPNTARRALDVIVEDQSRPFCLALGEAIRRVSGVIVPEADWRPTEVPGHLQVRFVVNQDGRELAQGRDLTAMASGLGGQLTRTVNAAAAGVTHPGAVTWAFGSLPERVGDSVQGYPALVDQVSTVGVRAFPDPAGARRAHLRGLRRLIALTTPDATTWVISRLSNPVKFALATSPYPSVPDLLADARLTAIGDLLASTGDPVGVRDEARFSSVRDRVRERAADRMLAVVGVAGEVLARRATLAPLLARVRGQAAEDITDQLANLVYPGFLAATEEPHFSRLPVYLRAIEVRLGVLVDNPARDVPNARLILELEREYAEVCARFPAGGLPIDVAGIGWMLEELRVGLFAQSLGTPRPVSAKRIRTAIGQLQLP